MYVNYQSASLDEIVEMLFAGRVPAEDAWGLVGVVADTVVPVPGVEGWAEDSRLNLLAYNMICNHARAFAGILEQNQAGTPETAWRFGWINGGAGRREWLASMSKRQIALNADSCARAGFTWRQARVQLWKGLQNVESILRPRRDEVEWKPRRKRARLVTSSKPRQTALFLPTTEQEKP